VAALEGGKEVSNHTQARQVGMLLEPLGQEIG
jgi:hypothetical protein